MFARRALFSKQRRLMRSMLMARPAAVPATTIHKYRIRPPVAGGGHTALPWRTHGCAVESIGRSRRREPPPDLPRHENKESMIILNWAMLQFA